MTLNPTDLVKKLGFPRDDQLDRRKVTVEVIVEGKNGARCSEYCPFWALDDQGFNCSLFLTDTGEFPRIKPPDYLRYPRCRAREVKK